MKTAIEIRQWTHGESPLPTIRRSLKNMEGTMLMLKSLVVVFLVLVFTTLSASSASAQGLYAQIAAQDPDDTVLVSPEEFLILSDDDDEDPQELVAAGERASQDLSDVSSDDDVEEISSEIESLRTIAERLRSEIDKDNSRRDEIVEHIHDLDKSNENFASWLHEFAAESDTVLGWIIREQNLLEEIRWQIKDLEEKKWDLVLAQKTALSSESP